MKVHEQSQMTPAKAEAVHHLAEEAAEIAQACMKALRHGFDSTNPDDPGPTNLEAIADEVGDLLAAVDILEYNIDKRRPGMDWFRARVLAARVTKLRKVADYMHQADVPPTKWAIP